MDMIPLQVTVLFSEWTENKILQLILISQESDSPVDVTIIAPMTSRIANYVCRIDCRYKQYFFTIYNSDNNGGKVSISDTEFELFCYTVETNTILQEFYNVAVAQFKNVG